MATKNSLAKFRLESDLWSEFKAKCETTGKPYSQVLREFCLTYVSVPQGLEMFTEVEESGQMGLRLDGNNSTDTNLDVVVHSVGELYSGPGGIGLGAARASVVHNGCRWITEPKWVNDYDPDSCKTWENNVLKYEREQKGFSGSVDIHVGDVRSLNIEELAPVDGFMFGFPCNDFSLVGEQKGFDGAFGPLYSYGVKVLQKSEQPQWFIAENVGGITSSNEGTAFKVILDDLRSAGYQIVAHKFKFEEYRVPQARHRVIIIGFRDDLGIKYRVPAPLRGTVTAAQALANIPSWAKHQDLTRQSAQVVERLSHIKPGQNAWNSDLPQHLKLNVPNTQLSHIYKKLDPSLPAYTVTGSGGGGTHMYHWAENRALTNRERARLQTFPDWFEFAGSKESIRKQIGMAIPVAGAQLVVESVLKCLAGVDYKCVPPNVEIG
jgi:DNA (cytosine-5)-methyltransferase 1